MKRNENAVSGVGTDCSCFNERCVGSEELLHDNIYLFMGSHRGSPLSVKACLEQAG